MITEKQKVSSSFVAAPLSSSSSIVVSNVVSMITDFPRFPAVSASSVLGGLL